jgi:replication initiation protein RepC
MRAAQVDPDAVAHKWRVFNDIREAKEALGVTDRALAILNALLTFHPETTLSVDGSGSLVVFPSNTHLIARSYGMSPATLRRHLSNLVEAGIIIRRDSPNGKRFARRGEGGAIEQAYGFDLSPLIARAEEFATAAEDVRTAQKAMKVARERLTLVRRDIVKLIEFGVGEGMAAAWSGFYERYRAIMDSLPRQATLCLCQKATEELSLLRADIQIMLNSHLNVQNTTANESQFERHIQNSKPEGIKEPEQVYQRDQTENPSDPIRLVTRDMLPLKLVLDACPNIVWVGKGGEIRSWTDLQAAADLVRPMLGISPSAWAEARSVLGPDHATVTLVALYQRADLIHSAGGYLRNLVERARNGKFTVWPMLMALLRAKLDGAVDGVATSSRRA